MKNEILTHATMWVNPRKNMPTAGNQSQKTPYSSMHLYKMFKCSTLLKYVCVEYFLKTVRIVIKRR